MSLKLKNVYFSYPSSKIDTLTNLNLSITSPKIIGLLGINGSGKSTLLKLFAGLLRSTKGTVQINDIDIKNTGYTQDHVSYIPENAKLFLIGPTLRQDLQKIIKDPEEVDKRLIEYKINSIADQKLYHLSEGQRRLGAIINAFLLSRSIILFDEPTIGIDQSGREILINLFQKAKESNSIIFVSTNDHRLFPFMDDLIVLQKGEIILQGPSNDVLYLLEETSGLHPNSIVRLIMKLENELQISIPHVTTVEQFNKRVILP